ncbi:MAG TPA: Ppx/GppA family phosphatase [Nitrospirae bacterium]|nr:exopolyphosphatase [bacterium BMS3Abin09]HDH33953.1 Ppx/GppA family phosphatase [Nitrospirota bacterium]HDZ84293.1 Ppx/GppA family phosphatase [Nitrospirota bacterium]
MTYAAIDIGTNTFRLLIAEVRPGQDKNIISFDEICSKRIITRLGEDISENGLLNTEVQERGIKALKEFADLIAEHKTEKVLAIATSALRKAKNSLEFINKVKDLTDLEIKIITGEKEAWLTAAGMAIDINRPGPCLMLDIGGGSTELIFTGDNAAPAVLSLDLGVVYLTDKYMKSDPPSDADLKLLEYEISHKLESVICFLPIPIPEETVFIGTAGTITALAAAVQRLERYDHERIHNFKLNMTDVNRMYCELSRATTSEKSKFLPFEPSRLDIIVPGTLILLKLMQITKFYNITVSNYGLLEGILAELYIRSKE